MSAKMVLGAILVAAWLTCPALRGQEIPNQAPRSAYPIAEPGVGAAPAEDVGVEGAGPAPGTRYGCGGVCPSNTGLSDWITYRRHDGCLCEPGAGKTLGVEVYMRTGISIPVGGGLLNDDLHAGWRIEGGVRSLWFEPTFTKAWVWDAGIVNVVNGGAGDQHVPLSILVTNPENGQTQRVNFGQGNLPGVTISSRNRTMVGLGLGREMYLLAPANAPGNHWRIGWDFGGRWGTEKMEFNEIRHRTRVLENMFLAAHTDYEFTCCDCIFYTGFRLEWSYTWSTILQTQHDMQDIFALFSFGIRH